MIADIDDNSSESTQNDSNQFVVFSTTKNSNSKYPIYGYMYLENTYNN